MKAKYDNIEFLKIKFEYFCAYRERSENEIKQKLFQLNITEEKKIEQILKHLKENNFLNEARYIQAFVKGKSSIKKWGKVKIKAQLLQQKIEGTLIEDSLHLIDTENYNETLQLLLEKKIKSLQQKELDLNIIKQKCIKYALQKGYEMDLIFEVFKKIKL